jgi:hypothetical protein
VVIDHHMARAALRQTTPKARGFELAAVTQHVEQHVVVIGLHLVGLTVQLKTQLSHSLNPPWHLKL